MVIQGSQLVKLTSSSPLLYGTIKSSLQQRGLNDLAYEKIFLTKRRVRDVWTSILASFETFVTRLHFPEGVSFGRDNFLPSAPQNLGFSFVACLSLVISARKITTHTEQYILHEMLEICCLWYCTINPHTSCVTKIVEESCQHDMIRILVGFVSTCQMIRDRKDAEEFQIYQFLL